MLQKIASINENANDEDEQMVTAVNSEAARLEKLSHDLKTFTRPARVFKGTEGKQINITLH